MIQAVIFDANGPLYHRTSDVAKQKKALVNDFGCSAPFERFEAAYKTERFKGYVRAKTIEVMFQDIFLTMGCHVSPEAAVRFAKKYGQLQSQVTAVPDAIATLETLKERKYKTCVLTDSFYSAEEKWTWFRVLGMDKLIDHMISSYDIRHLKDTPEAYQACLEALEIAANEAIFVGHQEYEMVGAKKIGVTSVAVLPISPPNIDADYTIESLSELPGLLQQIS